MSLREDRRLQLHDFKPGKDRFLAEILKGLRMSQKELPSKYLYDECGSQCFERICALDEYYIPRVENLIMEGYIGEIVELLGPRILLIEYGSGECNKIRVLLDKLDDPVAYMPIDISREQMLRVTDGLTSDYPATELIPVCADYTSDFTYPVPKRPSNRIVVYFPGSTISNFDPIPARHFLEHITGVCGPGGALLIGVDLKKDPSVFHQAYNDSQGITAAFNLNLLRRINRELDCDFQLECFEHYAFYNPKEGRIEMHLVSLREQIIHLGDVTIPFAEGESIWTESSYKFNIDEFAQIAAAVGFKVERVWTDEKKWFSVQYLVNTERTTS